MILSARKLALRASVVVAFSVSVAVLAGCSSSTHATSGKKRSKEYFSETEYGVKASPRVSGKSSRLPRGGGRDQVGKPYKVRGVWYHPKEEKQYSKVGAASWYGDAFHGRLTANGEIYDQTHLTAAHPTMPLPSYVRVTNIDNGSSVIVRVNDRGPYSNGRIIDLSRRAAEMLDYKDNGVAQVKVEYIGRARLDGQDEQYLLASYQPGNRAPDPSDGLPSGVMIAMDGSTPGAAKRASPFPGVLNDATPQTAMATLPQNANQPMSYDGAVPLPLFAPIAPERPQNGQGTRVASAIMSYADERINSAAGAFAVLDGGLPEEQITTSWKSAGNATAKEGRATAFVAAGTFSSHAEALGVARALSHFGQVELENSDLGGHAWFSINLYAFANNSLDELLEAAWQNGAPNAIVVRD